MLLAHRLTRTACVLQTSTRRFTMSTAIQNNDAVVVGERKGNIAIATLNRPRVLNSLNKDMIDTMLPMYKEWNNASNVKAIVLQGAGGKAFCAGGDVVAVAKAGQSGGNPCEFFADEYTLDNYIHSLSKPHVAIIHGITMGGGVGVSVHGSHRVCTERTMFAMPETAIGLFPDVGGAYFLPRLKGALGMYLALTGHRLKGVDVLHAGIATHYIESVHVDALIENLAKVSDSEHVAHILEEAAKPSVDALSKPFSLDPVMPQINECFGKESVPSIIKALEDDGSEWATKQLEILRKMSPTSLIVSHEQITRGKSMSLSECLAMEYGIGAKCMQEKDFYEGIRAVLVDKDHAPKWSPATVEELDTDAVIAQYFDPALVGDYKP